MASLVVIPILTYAITTRILLAAQANPLDIRHLPGREPIRFFLWPAKNGYRGAADYGRAALQGLPPNAVLLADHTPLEPLRYLQMVEGLRPDVRLVAVEPGSDLAPVVADQPAGAPIFLADNNPAYYNLSHLPGAGLKPAGVVYRLLLPP